MNQARILPVILAGALQLMPFLRATIPIQAQGLAQSSWAVVLRLTTGAIAFFGYHAISGATTIVAPYTVSSSVGKAITRQLSVSGQTAHSWSTTTAPLNSATFPLVPGVTLTQAGFIGGTPTQPGTNTFVITAWEFAGNTGRNMSQAFVISVSGTSPPTITTAPLNKTAAVGSNVTFTVAASGTAPLVYQWRFGSSIVAGATNTSLTITNVQSTNAGLYRIVVTNSAGAVSNQASLIVVSPPLIVVPMQDTIAFEGTSISLSPGVDGGPATAQWMLNNTVISGATTVPLDLPNVLTTQSGLYTVTLTNIAGKVTNSAQLLVVPPPSSSNAPRLAPLAANGPRTIAFPTLAGYSYLVQFTDQLSTNWVTLTNIPAAFTTNQISFPTKPTSSNGFYRVLMTN